ncbi:hypothetical protein C7416_101578 [Cupriavidus phytorum]|uniref:Uncharacterized protein n=2 Tax=Cupriavidus phytorum TaxID=3024399 RepID=A0A2W7PDI7_9BURK|nr:hypothetical protein C7416_101578 [Cupriavidus alkaliphilus]
MEYLDLSYDVQFASRPSLPWLPWVGKDFAHSAVKTMVLGESVYEWNPAKGSAGKLFAEPSGLRVLHRSCSMDFKRESKYVRNIERAILQATRPKPEQKSRFWTSVVYHDLVLDLLASRRHRPKPEQFNDGWREVFDLWGILGIEQCLVYGVQSADELKVACEARGLPCTVKKLKTKVGQCAPRYGTVTVNGREVRLLFVRHPSRCFSWRKWGPIIRGQLSVDFLATGPALAVSASSA